MTNKSGKIFKPGEIRRLGITSIYAGGKGTVCSLFGDLGARIIDLDDLARDAVKKNSSIFPQIIKYFLERGFAKQELILADGELNRRNVAKIVFRDKIALGFLNSITHPQIIQTADEMMTGVLKQDKSAKFALNIPLLFESHLLPWVDLVIVINTSLKKAIERGLKRDNLTREEIMERIENQIPLNEKIPLADYVIENQGTVEDLKEQVHGIWQEIQG